MYNVHNNFVKSVLTRFYYSFQRLSITRLTENVYSRCNVYGSRILNQVQNRTIFKGSKLPQSIEYSKKQLVG